MKFKDRRILSAIVSALFAAPAQASLSIPINDELTHAVAIVGVGAPPKFYTLLADTGSANTWVGASGAKPYVKTSTSTASGKTVSVHYGTGSFSGSEYDDRLQLGETHFTQSIGAASQSRGFSDPGDFGGVDGILGLGPAALTSGTVEGDDSVPTVADNLFSEGDVESATITITNDTITFGLPPSKVSRHIKYFPITEDLPDKEYWGVDAKFTYGGKVLQDVTAGILDHGTSLLLLRTETLAKFLKATGATMDEVTGLPMLSRSTSCDKLSPLILTLGKTIFEIPVAIYRWPENLNVDIGGVKGKCYLGVGESDTQPKGEIAPENDPRIDFLIGWHILKYFAVVLDSENSRVGLLKL